MPEPKDAAFDPYHLWLGIPKQHRPPTYYHLLGLTVGESVPEVIEEAAIRQSTHLRTYQVGPHAALCKKLLNEVGRARQVLLNPKKRAEYDRRLAGESTLATDLRDEFNVEPGIRVLAEKSVRRRSPFVLLFVVLAIGVSALAALGVVRFRSAPPGDAIFEGSSPLAADQGRIVVESRDPDLKVVVDKTGPSIVNDKSAHALKAGKHDVVVVSAGGDVAQHAFDLKSGATVDFKIEVVDDDVTIVRDGQVVASGSLPPLKDFAAKGHTANVHSVAFSPDGRRIVSGSFDATVKAWSATRGQELLTYEMHQNDVHCATFSPDGKWIASAGKAKIIKVWNSSTRQDVFALKGHGDFVECVAFSPDGTRIASGSKDQSLRVWDVASRQQVFVLRGHTATVHGVAFSADGKRIVSAGWDGTLKTWDASSGAEILTLKGHAGRVHSAAFNCDGTRIVSAGEDKTVKVWDAATGQDLLTLTGHTNVVYSAVFSPDGKRIASGSWDKTVKVWDAASGQELRVLRGHTGQVHGVAFSPDGKRIVSVCHQDRTLRVWDVENVRPGP